MGGRIIIGSAEREISNIEPNWINEQINRRRDDGVPVCVRVFIKSGDIDISLSTADCPKSSGGTSRPLTRSEDQAFDLWNKLHLNEKTFSSGNLVAFLKQLGI